MRQVISRVLSIFHPSAPAWVLLWCGALSAGGCARPGEPAAPDASSADSPIAFVDIRMFDGSRMLEHQTVVVEGDAISAVGASSEVSAPAGSVVFQGADYTLLPGFIDAHVHLAFYGSATVLKGGITTARDLGWPPDTILPLAESLAATPTQGPALLAAGPMITITGGYPSQAGWAPEGTALEVDTPEAGRAAVQDLVARGVTAIKVAQSYPPNLSLETLLAVVEEAHTAGLKVSSHVNSLEQLELALEAGVDDLAHGLWSDEQIPESVLQRMVSQGMVVVPTLHIDPSSERIDNLGAFVALGGKVVYGTDMGNFGPPPGIDADELGYMVSAGMTLSQALASATSEAAAYLGLEDRGRIAAGLQADLVLVDGNPEEELGVLSAPVLVLREGVMAQ